MRIAIADNCGLKFCRDIMEYWTTKGHEVKYERGASEVLAQWADIYYVEWADGNIHYLYNLYHDDPGHNRTKDWDNNKKPLMVCRAIDWDIWTGGARDQNIVEWVDKWICITPHMEQKLRQDSTYREGQLKCIRPGVNLNKFTLKTKITDRFQLGMVLGDFWPQAKNHMAGLDIFTMLWQQDHRWHLHLRGQHEVGEYWPVMYDYYLDSRGIRDAVTLYGVQEDMNAWYENIDILLHPGLKETFCYAVGEAAAKGIPVVINDFYGSHDIWPKEWLYKTNAEGISMVLAEQIMPRTQTCLRNEISTSYSLERMMQEYDLFIGT